MRIRVNLSESRVDPIPTAEGYRLKITTIKDERTTQSGMQQLPIVFTITDGPESNKTITRNFNLSGRGAGFFDDLCDACGLRLDVDAKKEVEVDVSELIGCELIGDIELVQPDAENGLRRPRSELTNFYPIP